MNNDLERDFLKENKTGGYFSVIVGKKRSGKSWLMTNYLAISYYYNLYDEYHLILPEYATDANKDTYSFIEGHPNTIIYNKYNPNITENIKKASKDKRILYILDDSTSYMFKNKHNEELINLVSTCRHGLGITVIVACHALKQVLDPIVRGMIDFLFVGTFTNYTIIKKHLYEENCSMLIEEKEFMEEYKEKIIRGEYNFLFIDGKCRFSFDVDKWELSTFDRKKAIIKGSNVKVVNYDKKSTIKDKILQDNEKQQMKIKYGIKYKPPKDNGMMIKFNKSRRK